MQAVPLGPLPPGKSGQLEKDLGLEASSLRHGYAANNFRDHEVLLPWFKGAGD